LQVNELSAELTEEQATASASAEKIEQEMLEKQQIENQHSNLKSRYQSLENEKQQLELDLTYSISDVNGESTPDEFNDNSVYK
jgi:arginine deiminase